jgi:hypothetical protein
MDGSEHEAELPPPPMPYFPELGSEDSRRLPRSLEYPVVHERCAVQMAHLRARSLKDAEEEKETKDDRIVEEAVRLCGTRTSPLGEDRHGRFYWKMPGDDTRLFVVIRDGDRDRKLKEMLSEEELAIKAGRCHWLCYETREDIQALVGYLDSRSSREGPLRESIVHEFLADPKPRRPWLDESIIIREKPKPVEDTQPPLEALLGEAEGASGMDLTQEGNEEGTTASLEGAVPMSVDEADSGQLQPQQPEEPEQESEPVALKIYEEHCKGNIQGPVR